MIFTVQHEREDTHQGLGQPHHHRCNGRRMDRCYASNALDQIKPVILTDDVFQEVSCAMELWGIVKRTKCHVKERNKITNN